MAHYPATNNTLLGLKQIGIHLLFKAGTMTTEAVVRKALAGRRNAIVIPGFKNLLLVWLGKLSPRLVTRRLAGMLQA